MTYALGYVTSRSCAFAAGLAQELGFAPSDADSDAVVLQDVDDDGRTDIEFQWSTAHVILEAKRGPALPTRRQLERYALRFDASERREHLLVAVTNALQEYGDSELGKEIRGIAVRHLTWRRLRVLARRARRHETLRNKNLLDDFTAYLTEILGMENARSNMVYVVSLGSGGAWGLAFKDVVTKHQRYFYPKGPRWPAPPNYIAFRYGGHLQSIHHVAQSQVFDNPRRFFPEAADHKVAPHYLLELGPPIAPPAPVKAGPKILRSMRVWCMLDLLLTSPTITAARDETKRRLGGEDI